MQLQSPPGGPAVERALCVAAVAAEIAERAGDPTLAVRVGIIDGYRGVLAGEDDARSKFYRSSVRLPNALTIPTQADTSDLAFPRCGMRTSSSILRWPSSPSVFDSPPLTVDASAASHA